MGIRLLRLTALVPLAASVVTVVLTILLLASGTSPSSANDQFWIAINMSGLGGNLIEVKPISSSSSASSNDPLVGFINGIPGLAPLLDNLTTSIGDGLSDLQGSILGNLTGSLGVKDTYILYVTKMCQGDFEDPGSPDSGVNIDSCYSYRDGGSGLLNISNSIPSAFQIGTAEVSVPLVASLKQAIGSIVNLAIGAATAMEVLLIIGCVTAGLVAVGSLLGIVVARSRLVAVLNVVAAALASAALLALAVAVTVVVAYGASTLNGFGAGFSLHLRQGGSFLAMLWVAAVLSAVAGAYWFAVWFVEFRRSAFSRRARRPRDQVGNWAGILGEVRRDLRVDGHFPPAARKADEEDHVLTKER